MRTARALIVTALAVGTVVTIAGKANAGGPGNIGFGTLAEPNGPASWLVNHYDNRTPPFSSVTQVTGGPAFDDSAEVKFVGTVVGLGKVTVEQSAAWTFTTFAAAGAAPCALVYDSTNPRTLVQIHKHQGVSTENVTGPLTLRVRLKSPLAACTLADLDDRRAASAARRCCVAGGPSGDRRARFATASLDQFPGECSRSFVNHIC